jgi:hypothetical protein
MWRAPLRNRNSYCCSIYVSHEYGHSLKMTPGSNIFLGLTLAVIILVAAQVLGPRCWKYRFANDSIEFMMFGRFRVWRSSFKDITDIKHVSFIRLFTIFALSLVNKPFFARCVLVRLRRGVFRAVVVTPDQPQEFVRIVRERIGISPGPG